MKTINKNDLKEKLEYLDRLKQLHGFVLIGEDGNDDIIIDVKLEHYNPWFGEWSKLKRREILDSKTLKMVLNSLIDEIEKEIDEIMEGK